MNNGPTLNTAVPAGYQGETVHYTATAPGGWRGPIVNLSPTASGTHVQAISGATGLWFGPTIVKAP